MVEEGSQSGLERLDGPISDLQITKLSTAAGSDLCSDAHDVIDFKSVARARAPPAALARGRSFLGVLWA
jgi:hypothetical protein